MEVIRSLQLKNSDNILIMDQEDDTFDVKSACVYIQKKTEDLSDEDFIKWVKDKIESHFDTLEERLSIDSDLYSGEFTYMQKIGISNFHVALVIVIDYLSKENGLINNVENEK